MAGSIKAVKGKKGVWEIRYDSEDVDGKRVQHKRRFSGSKGEAEKFLTKIQSQIIGGEYTGKLGDMRIRDYLDKWEKEYCKPNLAYKTFVSYSTVIRLYLKPELGGIKIANLQGAHIQSYYVKMGSEKKLSNTTVLYHHRILHEALKHAVGLGYIPFNPCDRVKPPRKNKPDMKVLTIDQARYFVNNFKDHRAYLPILLAIMTGMRQGEITGLCWKDLDLINNTISVTHTLQRQNSHLVLKDPKTKKSRRSIPITADLAKTLKKEEHQYKQNRMAWGQGYDERGFVCAWEDGRPFDNDWLSKEWRNIIKADAKRAEKEKSDRYFPDGVRFHDLRHTHASILLSQGLNLKIVQERLGHDSIVTTGDTYAHVTQAMSDEAARVLDNLFCFSKNEQPKKYLIRRHCVKNVSSHQ